MIVVNVKRVGGRLHSCCRMMLNSIFVLSKYDLELYCDNEFLFFGVHMENVKSNILWFVGVLCYIFYNPCANL